MNHTFTADRIITPNQMKKLLREMARERDIALSTNRNTKFVTDYYLVALAYNLGLRISELCALKWSDVGEDFIIVRRGKGGKPRTVFFGDATKKLFDELKKSFSNVRKNKISEHLFIGQRGPLTRGAVHLRFRYWLQRTDLPETLTFHSLRHGFATRLLDGGVPIASVRDQLGHANIATTSLYLHLTEAARDKIKRLL